MKVNNNLYSIELTSYSTPIFKENKRGGFVEFGENNSFPTYLVDLFNSSSVHNAIVTGKTNYIRGRGLTVSGDFNTETRALIEKFIYEPNPYEDWQSIFDKITLDYELYNGYALEVKKDSTGRIIGIYHIDFGKLRASVENPNEVYYSNQWLSKYDIGSFEYRMSARPNYVTIPMFSQRLNHPRSIYYYREYRPNMSVYPLPDYVGAIQNIRTQIEISNFDLNTIINGFAGGTLVNFFNGKPLEEEKDEIERRFNEKAAGSNNGNRILLNFADSKDAGGAEILPLMGNDLPDRFKQLEERTIDNIFIGHKITSPMLFGVRTQGQLGGRNEILEAYELFKETYIVGRQRTLLDTVNSFFEYKGLPRCIDIEELRPLQREMSFSEPTIIAAIGNSAVKEYIGDYYGVNIEEEKNVNDNAEQLQSEKVNLAVADYFKDKGESADKYEILASFPVDFVDGKINFAVDEMQVDFADPSEKLVAEVAKILKSNKVISAGEIAKALNAKVSEVEAAIKTLVDKKMLVVESTGMRVLPAAESIIRLLPNPNEQILVKYKYGLRLDMSGSEVIAGTRDFCRNLISNSKLYTKQEIEGMKNDMDVTFLPNIQDVWLYRGGWYRAKGSDTSVPFCRHVWHQVLVKEKK